MPHVNQETTQLKALKAPGLSTEYCGWCIFMWNKAKAESQILLCCCSALALIKIWGQKELPSIHNTFFFPKLHFSYKYPWETTLRVQYSLNHVASGLISGWMFSSGTWRQSWNLWSFGEPCRWNLWFRIEGLGRLLNRDQSSCVLDPLECLPVWSCPSVPFGHMDLKGFCSNTVIKHQV